MVYPVEKKPFSASSLSAHQREERDVVDLSDTSPSSILRVYARRSPSSSLRSWVSTLFLNVIHLSTHPSPREKALDDLDTHYGKGNVGIHLREYLRSRVALGEGVEHIEAYLAHLKGEPTSVEIDVDISIALHQAHDMDGAQKEKARERLTKLLEARPSSIFIGSHMKDLLVQLMVEKGEKVDDAHLFYYAHASEEELRDAQSHSEDKFLYARLLRARRQDAQQLLDARRREALAYLDLQHLLSPIHTPHQWELMQELIANGASKEFLCDLLQASPDTYVGIPHLKQARTFAELQKAREKDKMEALKQEIEHHPTFSHALKILLKKALEEGKTEDQVRGCLVEIFHLQHMFRRKHMRLIYEEEIPKLKEMLELYSENNVKNNILDDIAKTYYDRFVFSDDGSFHFMGTKNDMHKIAKKLHLPQEEDIPFWGERLWGRGGQAHLKHILPTLMLRDVVEV